MQDQILFAAGTENSRPMVQGGQRRDQMAESGRYDRWRDYFDLCKQVGARAVRYGPPYCRPRTGPDYYSYNWSHSDVPLAYLRERGLIPTVDLCRFGVPGWVDNFLNGNWSVLFADCAGAFARRYPWVMYSPVNEILVCAHIICARARGFTHRRYAQFGISASLSVLSLYYLPAGSQRR